MTSGLNKSLSQENFFDLCNKKMVLVEFIDKILKNIYILLWTNITLL